MIETKSELKDLISSHPLKNHLHFFFGGLFFIDLNNIYLNVYDVMAVFVLGKEISHIS